MLSKNNLYKKTQNEAKQVPHYGLRKLSIGVASVLLSTTLYFGVNAQADVVFTGNSTNSVTTQEPENSSADNQAGKSIVLSHHQDATGEENAQNVNGNSSSTDSEKALQPAVQTQEEKQATSQSANKDADETTLVTNSKAQQASTNEQYKVSANANQKNTKISPKMLAASAVEATSDDSTGISVVDGQIYYSYNAYKKAYADGTLPKLSSGTYPDPN